MSRPRRRLPRRGDGGGGGGKAGERGAGSPAAASTLAPPAPERPAAQLVAQDHLGHEALGALPLRPPELLRARRRGGVVGWWAAAVPARRHRETPGKRSFGRWRTPLPEARISGANSAHCASTAGPPPYQIFPWEAAQWGAEGRWRLDVRASGHGRCSAGRRARADEGGVVEQGGILGAVAEPEAIDSLGAWRGGGGSRKQLPNRRHRNGRTTLSKRIRS